MKKKLVFTFAMVISGAIIGAGFASGKEITTFFGKYGFWTIPFLLLVFALFCFLFYLFGTMGRVVKPKSISDMTHFVFGKFSTVMDVVILLCVFIVQSAMLAGADQIGITVWGSEYEFPYLGIFTVFAVVAVVAGGLKSVFKISNYIMPVILLFLTVILSQFFITAPKETVTFASTFSLKGGLEIVLYCFLYVSLNTMSNSFVIAQTGNYMRQRELKRASIITSAMVTVLVIGILLALCLSSNVIYNAEMPMVQLAYLTNNVLGTIYSLILWLAIYTSIVMSGYMLTKWLNRLINNDFVCIAIIMTLSFVFSRIGFGNLVTVFYPIKGAIGLIYIGGFVIYYFRHKKEIKQLS